MSDRVFRPQGWPSAAATAALLALAGAVSGCAGISDSISPAFADPAKYDLYNCQQLEPERKTLANREAELQGLMAKAETGVGGSLVAEVAYRNDYIATRGQIRLANEAWARNKCRETVPSAAVPLTPPAPPAPAKGAQRR